MSDGSRLPPQSTPGPSLSTSAQVGSRVTAADVERLLRSLLEPTELEVQDDSASHAGHTGASQGTHFSVRIVSDRFAGMARISRHRLVYSALRPLIAGGIHALAIDARSVGEPSKPVG